MLRWTRRILTAGDFSTSNVTRTAVVWRIVVVVLGASIAVSLGMLPINRGRAYQGAYTVDAAADRLWASYAPASWQPTTLPLAAYRWRTLWTSADIVHVAMEAVGNPKPTAIFRSVEIRRAGFPLRWFETITVSSKSLIGQSRENTRRTWNGLALATDAVVISVALMAVMIVLRYLTGVLRQARGSCSRCAHDVRATPTRCPECGAPVAREALIHGRPEPNTPAGVRVTVGADHLTVASAWRCGHGIAAYAFIVTVLSASAIAGLVVCDDGLSSGILAAWAVLLGLPVYVTIAHFTNDTVIVVSRDYLVIRHRPLPLWPRKSIRCANIERIDFRESARLLTMARFSVVAVLDDGRDVTLARYGWGGARIGGTADRHTRARGMFVARRLRNAARPGEGPL